VQSEAGKKMQQCIEALCRMHGAVSKLLVDFDKCVACPSTSVFGNTATKDLTYATKAAFWMPEGVFRYLSCKDNPRIVEAVTACFIEPTLDEPVLLIGRLEYAEDPLQARAMCDGWDLWYLYFPLRADWAHGVPRNCTPPPDMVSRIMTATLVSYPLYSVSRMAEVAEFLVSVRQVHQSAASVAK
jgi:hypothetical protein